MNHRQRYPRFPHPIRFTYTLAAALAVLVVAQLIWRDPWTALAGLVVGVTGLVQILRVGYWSARRDQVRAWRGLVGVISVMPRGVHFHADDGTCYRHGWSRVRGRLWHVLTAMPGEELTRIAASGRDGPVHIVWHMYLIRAGQFRITHHHAPLTMWPDMSIDDPTTTAALLRGRRRGDGLDLTVEEMIDLTFKVGTTRPVLIIAK